MTTRSGELVVSRASSVELQSRPGPVGEDIEGDCKTPSKCKWVTLPVMPLFNASRPEVMKAGQLLRRWELKSDRSRLGLREYCCCSGAGRSFKLFADLSYVVFNSSNADT